MDLKEWRDSGVKLAPNWFRGDSPKISTNHSMDSMTGCNLTSDQIVVKVKQCNGFNDVDQSAADDRFIIAINVK